MFPKKWSVNKMTNHLKEAGSLLYAGAFVFDFELEIREEKAKELTSLLTMYMTDKEHTLTMRKLENKNYHFKGKTSSHHVFFSHFSECMQGVAVAEWDAGIEEDFTLQRDEVLYEDGEMYVEGRYMEETFEDDATIEEAFEALREVIGRRNPANGDAIYFHMLTNGKKLSYDNFYSLVMNNKSANGFESALIEEVKDTKTTEITFEYSKRTREMAEKVNGHLEYINSEGKGPKLSVYLDGDFSYPGNDGESKEKMSEYIEEAKRGYHSRKAVEEEWGEETVKVLSKGEEIFKEVAVSTYYVKWLKENEAHLARGENKVCTALIKENGEWVDPCTVCVNRLQKEVAGCNVCHFKNVNNGSVLHELDG